MCISSWFRLGRLALKLNMGLELRSVSWMLERCKTNVDNPGDLEGSCSDRAFTTPSGSGKSKSTSRSKVRRVGHRPIVRASGGQNPGSVEISKRARLGNGVGGLSAASSLYNLGVAALCDSTRDLMNGA